MLTVDASVVVDWVAPDADPAGPARRLLMRLADQEELIAGPRLLLEEVSNALLSGLRRGRWDGAAADEAFDRLRRLPVQLLDTADDLTRAWELSRRYDGHPVYGMLYVALAERLGTRLVTADAALNRKAGRLAFVDGPDAWDG